MAISTPAQKPRGAASSTRSTSTQPAYRRAWPRILEACPCPGLLPSRPDRRRPGPGCSRATRSSPSPAGGPVTSSSGACWPTRPTSTWSCAGAAWTSTSSWPRPRASRSGAEVSSALFDKVRTCDNHCDFCFIYQLPPSLRQSLYLKDDDYRLSFLYGNFTTLTRFTEMDLERVVTERLSPLNVSIHATDPELRARMLRNKRGATSLRWLRALLDHGIEVHGQVVVCPGVNDGAVLDDTLCGILDEYPELATACIVPLGVSRYNTEAAMRPHTVDEAARRRRHGRGLAGRLPLGARPAPGVRRRRVLPAGRTPVPGGRRLRGLPPARERHRHGPRLRDGAARQGRGRVGYRRAARVLRLGRRGAGRGLPGASYRRPDLPDAPPERSGRRPHRRVRGGGDRAARGRARAARRPGPPRAQPVLRRQHRRHRPHGRRGPRPRAGRPARGPPLPPARRLPVGWAVPRRHQARGPAPPRRDHPVRRHLPTSGVESL